MQPVHRAFAEKRAVLAALLERSKYVRAEARAKTSPRFQAASNGKTWDVVEIATGVVHGFAFTYQAAINFVNAMEAGSASKTRAHQ
jgi:hypothetical protein